LLSLPPQPLIAAEQMQTTRVSQTWGKCPHLELLEDAVPEWQKSPAADWTIFKSLTSFWMAPIPVLHPSPMQRGSHDTARPQWPLLFLESRAG
jgi:hypothetical protein